MKTIALKSFKMILILFVTALCVAATMSNAEKHDPPLASQTTPSGHEGHDHAKNEAGHTDEDGDTESVWSQVGPGNAVEGFEPEESRILLSAKAQKRLGVVVETSRREPAGLWVESSALVYEDVQAQIYLVDREGWFVRTPIRLGRRSTGRFEILGGLALGRSYVADKAALIRMAELDLLAGDVAVSCH